MALRYNQRGRYFSWHFPQSSALPASNVTASATALPSNTWQLCKLRRSAMCPSSEHKATMRHFVGCQGPSGACQYPGRRVAIAPWGDTICVTAVVHRANIWHNSATNKYDFSSTNSSLSGRSCADWFTAALSHADSLICDNFTNVALQPVPPQRR